MRINASQCMLVASIVFGLAIATIQKMAFVIFGTAMGGTTGPLPEATWLAVTIQARGRFILIMATVCLILIHKLVRTEGRGNVLCVADVAAWLLLSLFGHCALALGLQRRLVN